MDLDAYFARIGYAGSRAPTLQTLNAITCAHTCAIPFENLDVLQGRAISLAPEAIFDKLVTERRGGYCFEQNALLLEVLSALGFQVQPLSARVRVDRPREFTPPRTHLFLRVELEQSYLTDCGVGGFSLTQALRLDTEDEQATPHEPRRILRESGKLFHQARLLDTWVDICEFTLEEMPPIDRELANWFTSAHPQSHFKNRLLAARATADGGRIGLLNDTLKIRDRTGHATSTHLQSPEQLLAVLKTYFNLDFPAGTVFGATGSPWPR